MKVKLILPLLIGLLGFFGLAAPTYAATSCGGISTAVIKCDNSGSKSVINDLLVTIVNFLAIGVGIAVLAGIVFGAFLYATADSSADQAKRGIGYVRNAVIALVIFIFMYAIINYLVPGGLF